MESVTETLKAGDSVNFTGFGKFSRRRARRPPGRQPAHRRARADRRDDRAEVQRPAASSRRRSRARQPSARRVLRGGPARARPPSFWQGSATDGRRCRYRSGRWPSPRSRSPTGWPPRSSASGSQLVVGLDPQPDLLPVELRGDVARFCCGIVDAVAPHAVAVKPQLAFFEALGAEGMRRVRGGLRLRPPRRAARDRRRQARRHRLDRARLRRRRTSRATSRVADALTVNPWLGRESVEPFLAAARAVRHRHLLRRQDLERGRRRAGRDALRRPADVAPRRGARRRVGRGDRRRARPLVRRRGRRRDAPARGRARRGKLMPQTILLLPGRRRAGRRGRPTSRARSRAARRARSSPRSRSVIYAFRDAGERLPRRRPAPRRRGCKQRDLGRLRLVARRHDRLAPLRGSGRVPARGDGRGRRSCAPGSTPATTRHAGHRRPTHAQAVATTTTTKRHATTASPRHSTSCRPATRSASISTKTGVPRRAAPRAEPEASSRPRSSSARRSACGETRAPARRRSSRRCCRWRRSGRRAPPRSTARAWLVENARDRRGARRVAARDARLPIASITKLMTVLVALEHHKLTDVVDVDPRAAAVGEETHRPARRRAAHGRATWSRPR